MQEHYTQSRGCWAKNEGPAGQFCRRGRGHSADRRCTSCSTAREGSLGPDSGEGRPVVDRPGWYRRPSAGPGHGRGGPGRAERGGDPFRPAAGAASPPSSTSDAAGVRGAEDPVQLVHLRGGGVCVSVCVCGGGVAARPFLPCCAHPGVPGLKLERKRSRRTRHIV